MSQNVSREQLSALLDEELSEFEVRQLLQQRLTSEYQEFARWQLVKDVLKGQPVAAVPAGFAEQITHAVNQEKHDTKLQWWTGLAKSVVAASVAAATVSVGWQFLQADTQSEVGATVAVDVKTIKESPIRQAVRRGASTELVGLKPQQPQIKADSVEFLAPLLREAEAPNPEEAEQLPRIHLIDIAPRQSGAQQ